MRALRRISHANPTRNYRSRSLRLVLQRLALSRRGVKSRDRPAMMCNSDHVDEAHDRDGAKAERQSLNTPTKQNNKGREEPDTQHRFRGWAQQGTDSTLVGWVGAVTLLGVGYALETVDMRALRRISHANPTRKLSISIVTPRLTAPYGAVAKRR